MDARLATPAYATRFQDEESGTSWDDAVYGDGTYDSFIWQLEKDHLWPEVQRVMAGRRVTLLDFACGTGRVLRELEPAAGWAVGVDISPVMLAEARKRTPRAELRCGDLLELPGLLEERFELITVFRFFLHTEPAVRLGVMKALAARLDGPAARLIFNVHGNAASVLGLRGRLPWSGPRAETLSLADVHRLVDAAGLAVESWYGLGVVPRRLHLTRLSPVARAVDAWAARSALGQRLTRPVARDLLFVCRQKPAAARA